MEKVLIIDRDRFVQHALQESLHKTYEVRTADDGYMGLRLAREWHPDVIVLDAGTPDRRGYETCAYLKHDALTSDIPVIFLASHTSVAQLIKGLEAGADDYLDKGLNKDLLPTKIAKLSGHRRQKAVLRENASFAEKTAREAMASNFELGKAVRFVERTHAASSVQQLGQILMDVLCELGLNASALFVTRSEDLYFSSSRALVQPLEMELLKMLHTDQRFIDFGCRTQINYPDLALLIKNMPLQDTNRYGRIKDTMPFLLGATAARLRVLLAEEVLQEQNGKLADSIHELQSALGEMTENFTRNQAAMKNIMSDLTLELSLEMHRMGLEADQEEFIHRRVERALTQLHRQLVSSENAQELLQKTLLNLRDIADGQRALLARDLIDEAQGGDPAPDIELF